MEEIVYNKRRHYYEEILKTEPWNYDVWIDLVNLEDESGDTDNVRDTYERAIA